MQQDEDTDILSGGEKPDWRDKELWKRMRDGIGTYKKAHGINNPKFIQELVGFGKEYTKESKYAFRLTDEQFRQFLANGTNQPNKEDREVLRQFLIDRKVWDADSASVLLLRGLKDHPFFSLVDFLAIPRLTNNNLRNRAPGIYRVYRPIVMHHNHFVCGLIRIWEDNETKALHFLEYNRVKAKEGRPAKEQTIEGFFFRKTNFIYLFGRDIYKSAAQLTVISSADQQRGKLHTMLGGFLDTIGSDLYSGKVFIERLADEMDEADFEKQVESLDSHPMERLPQSIRNFFEDNASPPNVQIY